MGRKAKGDSHADALETPEELAAAAEGNGITAAAVPGGPVESKADKFRRLAMHRMPKAIKAIRAIRNLANKSGYEWSEDAASKIVDTLQKEVSTLAAHFRGAKEAPTVWTL